MSHLEYRFDFFKNKIFSTWFDNVIENMSKSFYNLNITFLWKTQYFSYWINHFRDFLNDKIKLKNLVYFYIFIRDVNVISIELILINTYRNLDNLIFHKKYNLHKKFFFISIKKILFFVNFYFESFSYFNTKLQRWYNVNRKKKWTIFLFRSKISKINSIFDKSKFIKLNFFYKQKLSWLFHSKRSIKIVLITNCAQSFVKLWKHFNQKLYYSFLTNLIYNYYNNSWTRILIRQKISIIHFKYLRSRIFFIDFIECSRLSKSIIFCSFWSIVFFFTQNYNISIFARARTIVTQYRKRSTSLRNYNQRFNSNYSIYFE